MIWPRRGRCRPFSVQSPLPPVSSFKGAVGHTLGAAGAINAAVSVLCISHGIMPANTGCREPDPALQLMPVAAPLRRPVSTVLSNAFGFGGNNASIVLGKPAATGATRANQKPQHSFCRAWQLLPHRRRQSRADLEGLAAGDKLSAAWPRRRPLCRGFNESAVRRLKRLPRMALSLATAARGRPGMQNRQLQFVSAPAGEGCLKHMIFFRRLFSTQERFTSPTDFIGSVHNAPAGQAGHTAFRHRART